MKQNLGFQFLDKKLSVGVPTHAEGKFLETCISSVVNRISETNYGLKNAKIFLTLSGISENNLATMLTKDVAEHLKKKYGDLIDLDYCDRGKANAVNKILKKSKKYSDTLIMIDSDVTFNEHAFSNVLTELDKKNIVLTRGKSNFFGKTKLTSIIEQELKRKNILHESDENNNYSCIAGPLYAVKINKLYDAFKDSKFKKNNLPRIPSSIICEDQFIADILIKKYDKTQLKKVDTAVYNHPAFNIENGALIDYWIRGIKGGMQLWNLGSKNSMYKGFNISDFLPNKSIEFYDEDKKLVYVQEVNKNNKEVQKIYPFSISDKDKLIFQKNLQYLAKISLEKDNDLGYWKPLNK